MKRLQKKHNGFYIIYAVLFIISIGFACAFYLNQFYQRSYSHALLHAKVQLQLYARSIKNMVKLCIQKYDLKQCKTQEFSLPHTYHFRAILTQLDTQSILLDIHGHVVQPSSNNNIRITKRYVLFIPPKLGI